MTSTPDEDPTAPDPTPAGVDVAAHSPLRFDGLPDAVDPARWVSGHATPSVPGSILAGDAYTAGEVQQG